MNCESSRLASRVPEVIDFIYLFFVGHKKPTGKGKKQNIRTALLSSILHLSQDLWMIPET